MVTQQSPRPCVLCGNIVCRHIQVNDSGQRMSDTVNNVRMSADWDDIKNGWMAFKLADGTTDGVSYDSRDDAIWYHRNKADKYFYLSLRQCMHGMTPREATQVLAMMRVQSERGRYNPQIGDRQESILPITTEDYQAELVSTKLGVPWVSPDLGRLLAN